MPPAALSLPLPPDNDTSMRIQTDGPVAVTEAA